MNIIYLTLKHTAFMTTNLKLFMDMSWRYQNN